jgi:glycerol-3-phosphate dehydrogenase
VCVLDAEIDYILGEVNLLFPGLGLTRRQVLHAWCGVRPMSTLDGETVHLPVRAIEDSHRPGLVTVTGSYIMVHRHAGRLAARVVEKQLGRRGPPAQGMRFSARNAQSDEDVSRIVATEHVVRLTDLIRRRLPDGLNPSLGRDRAEHLSHVAARTLGWTEAGRLRELRAFEEETSRIYRRF